jgi:N-acetylglucosaminyldiphosphoundecaprenol N-acetyl-beta-D-mannosaminyltransferase
LHAHLSSQLTAKAVWENLPNYCLPRKKEIAVSNIVVSDIAVSDVAVSKMNILGVKMDCVSYEEMHSIFQSWLSDKGSRSHSLALINVNCCVSALFDRRLRSLYNSADLVGIDSMPFLRWARAFYKEECDRFYAPDLMLELSSKATEYRYTFFLYGGSEEAPDKMEQYLKERFDGVRIVGKYSPPFRNLTEEEDRAVCQMINEVQPDFLWVGLGSPKQDVWISEHRDRIRGTIMVASGATFDFFSGRIKQAPRWIRDSGFEWLYRLTQDFRRLWVRYTLYNVIFLAIFSLQLAGLLRFESTD